MFSDPTGFSETIDLTQQTLDFKTWEEKKKKKLKYFQVTH